MARVLLVDRYPWHAEALGEFLTEAGHAVLVQAPRLDGAHMQAFRPDAVVCTVYRQPGAYGRPIQRFLEDVVGARALLMLQRDGYLMDALSLVVAHDVADGEVPDYVPYDYFIGCRADPVLARPVVAQICVRLLARLPASPPVPAADRPRGDLVPPDPTPGALVGVTIRWGEDGVG